MTKSDPLKDYFLFLIVMRVLAGGGRAIMTGNHRRSSVTPPKHLGRNLWSRNK